jgi:hypothetical protein
MANFLSFNSGFHAAHHEFPELHWSQLREFHNLLAPEIDPRLIQHNMLRNFIEQYVLGVFVPKIGTTQIGSAPHRSDVQFCGSKQLGLAGETSLSCVGGGSANTPAAAGSLGARADENPDHLPCIR